MSELEDHKLSLKESHIDFSKEFLKDYGYEIIGYLGVGSFGAVALV